jgi:alkylhydroperoxidase family enzyme
MARLPLPDGPGDEVTRVWSINPAMGLATATFSNKVYERSTLPANEREVARMRIAEINGCAICQSTRSVAMAQLDDAEERYANVSRWRELDLYTPRERLAIECAELFALDHEHMTQAFFDRLREHFDDAEILDLLVCISAFLANGRLVSVLGVTQDCLIELA